MPVCLTASNCLITISGLLVVVLLCCSSPTAVESFKFGPRIGNRMLMDYRSHQPSKSPQHEQPQQQQQHKVAYSPVLFIPGDGGTQLEAKLDKKSKVHYICDTKSDWYDLWLNIHLLGPMVIDCLIDNMKLSYNRTTRKSQNTEGVQIRVPNFGSLDSVDYLDISKLPKTDYFSKIISTLEKNNGLIRNVDMVGAGFDFRKAPNELDEFFHNLTNLIQEHYVRNNYQPVTIICHSMGCLNAIHQLNGQTQGWKDVFVRRLISLGAPWDGSFKAISAMLYGDNLGIPLLDKSKMQSLQSTLPSLMYLFPKAPTFEMDRVLVQTAQANYTLRNLTAMFDAAQMLDQKEMWLDTKAIAQNLTAPNVELWCLYGAGIETPSKIIYHSTILDGKFTEIEGDGDGTVNLESLRACEYFRAQQEKPVYTRQFDAIDHIDILRSSQPAEFISRHILSDELIS